MMQEAMGVSLDKIAHIIQVALTPIFLLSAIVSLLNVVTARLGRVADQADAVVALLSAGVVDRSESVGRLNRLK